jgi:hypothetical protein
MSAVSEWHEAVTMSAGHRRVTHFHESLAFGSGRLSDVDGPRTWIFADILIFGNIRIFADLRIFADILWFYLSPCSPFKIHSSLCTPLIIRLSSNFHVPLSLVIF